MEVGAEVTRLGGVKNNPLLHAILKLRHPRVHFLNIMVAKHVNKKNTGKPRVLAINALLLLLAALAATLQALRDFQGGVTRLAGVGFVIHQIRAKFTLAVAFHHY